MTDTDREPAWLRFTGPDGQELLDLSWPPFDGEVAATRELLAYENGIDDPNEIEVTLIYDDGGT